MKIILTAIDKKAKKLAKKIVKAKIAACVNIINAESFYRWDGKICGEVEKILLIKTDKKFKKVAKFIAKNHNYKLPEILALKLKKVEKKYKKWIKKESK